MTAILILGLAASARTGRHVMALLKEGHVRPLQQYPSPVPGGALLAAQLAVPVLGFFHVDPALWIGLLILVVALANLVPARPLGTARVPVEFAAVACAAIATLALLF